MREESHRHVGNALDRKPSSVLETLLAQLGRHALRESGARRRVLDIGDQTDPVGKSCHFGVFEIHPAARPLRAAAARTQHHEGQREERCRERKDEHQYVIRGAVDVELGVEGGELTTRRMQAGDTLHITPGTRHRITAVEDTDIVEISTPELDDVVRLADRYGRA